MKKWVAETIKDIAERGINGWRIKAEMPAGAEALKDEKNNEGPKLAEREETRCTGANQQTLLSVLQKVVPCIGCKARAVQIINHMWPL